MTTITLHIPIQIWQRIRYYIDACTPREVTGIGTITRIDSRTLRVTKVFLPNQCSSAGYCECDDEALNGIIFNLVEDNPARAGDLRFRWHSHANGQCFWSTTDQEDINNWQSDWVINLVSNVKGDILARLDMFEPFRIANIPLEVIIDLPESEDLRRECFAEAQQKVRAIPEPPILPRGKGGEA
jgi:hypothetical protein